MKKHDQINIEEIIKKLLLDINNMLNMKYLSIISHQYVEYFLNEIICVKFKHPEIIIDDIQMGTFYNKFRLLESIGVFDNNKDLKHNIKLINSIRNKFAHNMIKYIDEEIPNEVKSQIDDLKYLDEAKIQYQPWLDNLKNSGEKYEFDPNNFYKLSTISKFQVSTLSTVFVLIKLYDKSLN